MDDKIRELASILKKSDNIVFFGGAGVSTASNIPDFRSSTGLYSQKLNKHYRPEQAVSRSFFVKHPEEFFEFYKKNLIYEDAKPNDCHIVLAELEKMGKLKAIVTQNIDGLHQAAGSEKVFELHGTVQKNYCVKCGRKYGVHFVKTAKGVPICEHCGGTVRPDIVLYEEPLSDSTMLSAIDAIRNAETLIIGGTTLIVQPAAGLINYFKGKYLVLINKTKTPADKRANLCINDDIAMVMREAFNLL